LQAIEHVVALVITGLPLLPVLRRTVPLANIKQALLAGLKRKGPLSCNRTDYRIDAGASAVQAIFQHLNTYK